MVLNSFMYKGPKIWNSLPSYHEISIFVGLLDMSVWKGIVSSATMIDFQEWSTITMSDLLVVGIMDGGIEYTNYRGQHRYVLKQRIVIVYF